MLRLRCGLVAMTTSLPSISIGFTTKVNEFSNAVFYFSFCKTFTYSLFDNAWAWETLRFGCKVVFTIELTLRT